MPDESDDFTPRMRRPDERPAELGDYTIDPELERRARTARVEAEALREAADAENYRSRLDIEASRQRSRAEFGNKLRSAINPVAIVAVAGALAFYGACIHPVVKGTGRLLGKVEKGVVDPIVGDGKAGGQEGITEKLGRIGGDLLDAGESALETATGWASAGKEYVEGLGGDSETSLYFDAPISKKADCWGLRELNNGSFQTLEWDQGLVEIACKRGPKFAAREQSFFDEGADGTADLYRDPKGKVHNAEAAAQTRHREIVSRAARSADITGKRAKLSAGLARYIR